MSKIINFFGDPEALKERVAKMDDETFMLTLRKKEAQWVLLKKTKGAYMVFGEDADDAYGRDALCMKYLYDEKEKRSL